MICTEENIERIVKENIENIRFVGLYDPGRYARDFPGYDQAIIDRYLRAFMPDCCLMLNSGVLKKASDNPFIRTIVPIFNAMPGLEASVSIISMPRQPFGSRGLQINYYCEPITTKNCDFYIGLSEGLVRLKNNILGDMLSQQTSPFLVRDNK